MEHLSHLLIPIAGCAMIFGIVYVIITAHNRESMAMIEAGMNPRAPKTNRHSRLRIALLLFMVPIGILIGNLIHKMFGMDAEPAAVVFAFLFGGLALTTTYFIEDARMRKFGEEE
ncbi:MAG: putative tellurium resistance membrane protein TerC [Crocinitomix sp.]|jgi:predicted tellurium resistance membrane protein TerC